MCHEFEDCVSRGYHIKEHFDIHSVPQGCSLAVEVFSTMGDTMSIVGDILSTVWSVCTVGDKCGEIS